MAQIKKSTIFLGIAALAGLVAAVKFLLPAKSGQSEKSTATNSAIVPSTPVQTTDIPKGEMMKEAKSVTTKVSYMNPAGEDEVSFTLYVDSTSMIVDAKADTLATHDISKKRQAAFAEGFPTAVKGKKLSELTSIDKVGGSSLTTKAFNDTLATLKAQL
ncbi:MAG: hypothetical protein WAT81_04905 [Candidatus Moraniibacteriota bacterium]